MPNYLVYSDGSCSTHGVKAGGWAAVILKDDKLRKIVHGGETNTTIGVQEMRAIIEALEYIRSVENVHEICVEVFCDRQDVVYSAIGKYQRKSNKEEWRRFDRASKDMDLTVTHIPRNSIPEQELTDSISGQIREKLEQNPGLSPIHYSNTKP